MNLRCRSAVQPAFCLRVGAIANFGASAAVRCASTSSTTLSFLAIPVLQTEEDQSAIPSEGL